jgi:hypothetical protein
MGAYKMIDLHLPENQKTWFKGDMVLCVDKLPADLEFLNGCPPYAFDPGDGLGEANQWLLEFSHTDENLVIQNHYVLIQHHIQSPQPQYLEFISEFSRNGLEYAYLALNIMGVDHDLISWIHPELA